MVSNCQHDHFKKGDIEHLQHQRIGLLSTFSPLVKKYFLNLGCGRQFHPAWINLDIAPVDNSVLKIDIAGGLPFPDDQFDAIYHSHVLEHLDPDQGESLISECFRCLKPGGVLRIVVPDLEQIARLYLEFHQQSLEGNDRAADNYRWMKLELLDQMVRRQSGGAMGKYIADSEAPNLAFVKQRIGDEVQNCQLHDPCDLSSPQQDEKWPANEANPKTLHTNEGSFWYRFRLRLAMWLVRRILGRSARYALQEGLFRAKGEVHRWMYDRFSLTELCQLVGFKNLQVCTATESQIENFSKYQLDTEGDRVRKPDSIFFECRKPLSGNRSRT